MSVSTGACPPAAPSPDTSPPTAPTGLVTSAVTGAGLTLSWKASTDNVGVVAYNVYVGSGKVGTAASTSYAISGLLCGTSYSLAVEAYDAAGNKSAKGTLLSVATGACPPPPDTSPPSVPSGLSANTIASSSLKLGWNVASDNVGVAGYTTYSNGVSLGSGAATSSTVTGLACGTSYAFTVDAFDAAGNHSARSAVLNATTSACPAPPPVSGASANLWVDTSGGSCVRQASPARVCGCAGVFVESGVSGFADR